MHRALYLIALYSTALVALFLDFLTKIWAYHCLSFPMTGRVVGSWLGIRMSWTLVLNHGAAWGWLASWQLPLLIFRILVVIGLWVYFLSKKLATLAEVGLLLVILGAMGNIIDFFFYGAVVDFIALRFWGYAFPVFNLADCWITCGACLLLLHSARKSA